MDRGSDSAKWTRDSVKVPSYDIPGRPSSHAVRVPSGAGLVFLTGITARDHRGELVGIGNIDAQTRHVFKTVREILAAAGSDMEHVVKVTTYVTETVHLARAIAIRAEFFGDPPPATTGIIVKGLFDQRMLVEIEVVAMLTEQGPRT